MKNNSTKKSLAGGLLKQYRLAKAKLKSSTKLRNLIAIRVEMKEIYHRFRNIAKSMKLSLAGLIMFLSVNTTSYSNENSSLSFTFEKITGVDSPVSDINLNDRSKPTFVDLDNDGDFDLFVGEKDSDGTIYYFENVGSNVSASFVERTGNDNPLVDISVNMVASPSLIDIDNDGDFDAFIGTFNDNILYYENVGSNVSASFVERTGNDNALNGFDPGLSEVLDFVDIDNDNDFDVFVGENPGNINYYENVGTDVSASFVERTGNDNPLNAFDPGSYSAPSFVDIDDDGDFDLFTGLFSGTFAYFENVGTNVSASFEERSEADSPFGDETLNASSPRFVDIDNDGEFEVISGQGNGRLEYYENVPKGFQITNLIANEISITSTSFQVSVAGDFTSATINFELGSSSGNYSQTTSNITRSQSGNVTSGTFGLELATQYFLIANAETSSSFVTTDEISFWTLDSEPNQLTTLTQTNSSSALSDISLSWTANADNYLILEGPGSYDVQNSDLPQDGVSYSASDDIGNLTVVGITSSNTFSKGGFEKNQSFKYVVVPYNSGANVVTANYNTTSYKSVVGITIPTLGEGGMIAFTLLMGIGGVWYSRRS